MSSSATLPNLLGMSLAQLEEFFVQQLHEKSFRARQVFKWIHQRGVDNFDAMTDVSLALRNKLKTCAIIQAPEITYKKYSKDGTRKWVIRVEGGSAIEAVFIPEESRGTLCISSQIGCALDCSFCSTGKQGFNRDLTSSEIIGQLWIAARSWGEPGELRTRHITNVVMMGMGEPLLNFDNVMTALNIMLDDNAYGLSKRRVTVSTSGVVPGIYQLAQHSDVSLALSLHAPNDALRDQLVPLNRKYNLKETLAAVHHYFDRLPDKRVVTIEYTLLDRVNDEVSHAHEMSELLRNTPCKINLIPFNPFPNSGYARPSNNRVHRFKSVLSEAGYNVTVRKTRGDDIDAACGQLVGKVNDRTSRSNRFIAAVELGHTAATVASKKAMRST